MIKNTLLGGTDWADGQVLYTADLNDTFDAVVNKYDGMTFGYRQNAFTRTYTDSGDTIHYLSSLVAVALDVSAGKIYKTVDAGANWTEETTGMTTSNTRIYVNPNNCNYMIAFGDAYNDVCKYSVDAGDNWTAVTTPGTRYQIAYSISDTGRVYSMYNNGTNWKIGYTTNDGTSWTTTTNSPTIGGTVDMDGDNEVKLATPKNDIIAFACFDTSSDDSFVGYSLDGGATAFVEDTLTTAGSGFLMHCFYIDSDNYLIDLYTGGSTDGVHIIKFNGTVLSSSATASWGFIDSTNNTYRFVLNFTTTSFIYQETVYGTNLNSKVYKHDTTSIYPLIIGIDASSSGIDMKYLGIGLSSYARHQSIGYNTIYPSQTSIPYTIYM
jgi:hypothetical protein